MRSTLGLFLVATIVLVTSITLASRPRAVKQAQDHPASTNSELSTKRNSAAHAGCSSPLTTPTSGANTSSATAQATNGNIYFNSDRDGNAEIYAMNSSSLAQTRLTTNVAVDADPVGSPNDQRIAFVTNRDGNFQIYTMDEEGNNLTRLTNNAANDGAPDWSPNGQKIAFTSDRDGNSEIYTMNSDGSGQTRLTSEEVCRTA